MRKTILADVDGFTPVIDTVVAEMGLMAAVVFGRIWRFCQMEDKVCKASLEKIGESIGVDKATVMRHAKELCDAKYLKDLTPELRNRPHVYVDTGKAGISISISGVAQSNVTVAERNTTVAQSNVTVAESKLNKDLKKDIKETIEAANKIVDYILENAKQVKYQNRDKLPEPYWVFADLYHELTGQEPTKRVLHDWMMTFEEWKQERLEPENIRAAFMYANRPEGGFPVGRPGALTNTAVAMKTKMLAKQPSSPAIDKASVEATRKALEEKEKNKYVPMPEYLRQKTKAASEKISDVVSNMFPERQTE